MTPTELATKLAGSDNAGKVAKTFVRPYLRKHYARGANAKGTSWKLTPKQAQEITKAFKARAAS